MDKKCKKLGNRATKADRSEAHRVKMGMKQALREHYGKEAADNKEWIYANISKNHEHFGDTPSENEARKFAEKTS